MHDYAGLLVVLLLAAPLAGFVVGRAVSALSARADPPQSPPG